MMDDAQHDGAHHVDVIREVQTEQQVVRVEQVGHQSVVPYLQAQAFKSKLLVVLFTCGFDVCAALVFTLSLVDAVHIRVLQALAVAGAMMGFAAFAFCLACVPPTTAAFVKIAASLEHKGGVINPADRDDVLQRCKMGCTWKRIICCYMLSMESPRVQQQAHPSSSQLQQRWWQRLNPCSHQLLALVGACGLVATTCVGVPFDIHVSFMVRLMVGHCTAVVCLYLLLEACGTVLCIRESASLASAPQRSRSKLSPALLFWLACVGTTQDPHEGIQSFFSKSVILPGVWGWQCWVDLAAKAEKAISARVQLHALMPQGTAPDPPPLTAAHLQLSICAAARRLLFDSWLMIELYFLAEWVRVLLLVIAACVAMSWRLTPTYWPSELLFLSPDSVRAVMAVLSLAVNIIKSLRDKWKLLERGMQQFAYGAAVVTQLEQSLLPLCVRQSDACSCEQYLARWRHLEQCLQQMSSNALAQKYVQQQLQIVQEMLRRANKAVMSDNIKACYL